MAEEGELKRAEPGHLCEDCLKNLEVLGLDPDDEMVDIYPGTGAVTAAHETWKRALDPDPLSQMRMEAA